MSSITASLASYGLDCMYGPGCSKGGNGVASIMLFFCRFDKYSYVLVRYKYTPFPRSPDAQFLSFLSKYLISLHHALPTFVPKSPPPRPHPPHPWSPTIWTTTHPRSRRNETSPSHYSRSNGKRHYPLQHASTLDEKGKRSTSRTRESLSLRSFWDRDCEPYGKQRRWAWRTGVHGRQQSDFDGESDLAWYVEIFCKEFWLRGIVQ